MNGKTVMLTSRTSAGATRTQRSRGRFGFDRRRAGRTPRAASGRVEACLSRASVNVAGGGVPAPLAVVGGQEVLPDLELRGAVKAVRDLVPLLGGRVESRLGV